jgi:hypothetical protein
MVLCNQRGMLLGAARMLLAYCLDVAHCWCWFELQQDGEVLGNDADDHFVSS